MSITEKQILEAEGDVLSGLLGEVLQPDTDKHSNIANSKMKSNNCKRGKFDSDQVFEQHTCNDCTYVCRKCNKRLSWSEHQTSPCPVPNPIPLNWDNAMKYSNEAIEKYGVIEFLCVLGSMGLGDKGYILMLTIEQRLKASVLLEIGAKT